MKTYLSDVIPALRRHSKKLDDVTVLKNVHWKLVDEENGSRVVYIFRDHNELLISKNGEVKKGRWEYLGNDSLLIEIAEKAYLFKQGFYNEYLLGLKKDGIDEYAVLVDEEKVDKDIRSIEDLSYISGLLETTATKKKDDQYENNTDELNTSNDSHDYIAAFIIWIMIAIVTIIILWI